MSAARLYICLLRRFNPIRDDDRFDEWLMFPAEDVGSQSELMQMERSKEVHQSAYSGADVSARFSCIRSGKVE